MCEEELDEIIILKNDYEQCKIYVRQWLDYVYNKDRIRYSDDYYTIKIKETFEKEKELTIHLPTVVNAMEEYLDKLNKRYREKLEKEGIKE